MKIPANWQKGSNKTPAQWGGSSKTAQKWTGSSVVKDQSPAAAWQGSQKTAGAWTYGVYAYDCGLLYDSIVTYDGAPDPITLKTPANWSTT